MLVYFSFEPKVSYKFDIDRFVQNEMARKLSYKYVIEKQEKSLSQAKCPISLTVLYFKCVGNSLNDDRSRYNNFLGHQYF